MATRLDRLHEGTSGAVPVKTSSTGRVYAQLRDPRTQDAIDARVPVGLVSELPWNQEVVLAGLFR